MYIYIAYKSHSLTHSLALSLFLFLLYTYTLHTSEQDTRIHTCTQHSSLSFFLSFSFFFLSPILTALQFLLKYVYYGTKRGIGMYGNAWFIIG